MQKIPPINNLLLKAVRLSLGNWYVTLSVFSSKASVPYLTLQRGGI